LLRQNRFSSYLLYALGEIVLVVMGILIALQINTNSQHNKDREKEQIYLKSFRVDLEKDIEELDRIITKAKNTTRKSDSLLSHFENLIPLNDQEFEICVIDLADFTIYLSHEGTVRDIMGSGELSVIENDSVRFEIASWEADLKLIREWESLSKVSAVQYMDYLSHNADMYKNILGQPILSEEIISRILGDRYFLNLVSERKHATEILARLYKAEKASVHHTLSMLKREIQP